MTLFTRGSARYARSAKELLEQLELLKLLCDLVENRIERGMNVSNGVLLAHELDAIASDVKSLCAAIKRSGII